MGLRNDYRVSTIVVLCKDCDEDVGLYPARHKCNSNNRLPQLPKLCSSTTSSFERWNSQQDDQDVPDLIDSNSTSTTVTRQASDSSMESGKWSLFKSNSTSDVRKHYNGEQERPNEDEDESIYFDNYASNLKNSSSLTDFRDTTSPNGKILWGRMKENEKWKGLIAEKKESNKSGKLWERIIHATMSNSVDKDGPESDDDDWEGETHVSRILREYHQSKSTKLLPSWLYDDRTPISTLADIPHNEHHEIQEQVMNRKPSTRTRRLWQPAETQQLSSREKELQALRTERQEPDENYYKKPSVFRSQSERMPSYTFSSSSLRSIRHSQPTAGPDYIYGSTTPRRMNTTRLPPSSHYQKESNYIPSNTPLKSIRNNTYL